MGSSHESLRRSETVRTSFSLAVLLVGLASGSTAAAQELASAQFTPLRMDRGAMAVPSYGSPSRSPVATAAYLQVAHGSVWETVSADAIVRSLIPTPLERVGDPGSVDLGAEVLAAGTVAPSTAPPVAATSTMSAAPAVPRPSRSASVASLVPDYLYMGKKGLGLKLRW